MTSKVVYLTDNDAHVITGQMLSSNDMLRGKPTDFPTSHMIQIDDEKRWRRVYALGYSNAKSLYVNVKGERLFLHEYDLTGTVAVDAAI